MADWDDWRFALGLWRAGTTAARDLGTDISTVLRRVRRLEERRGVRVVAPHGHRYVASQIGRKLIDAAERMGGDVVQAERVVRDGLPTFLTGSLRVVISEDLVQCLLGRHLARFEYWEPDIHLDLIIDGRNLSLTHYEADVVVQIARPRLEGPLSVREWICPVAWSCYAHDRYLREVDIRARSPRDLSDSRVLAPVHMPQVRRFLQEIELRRESGLRSTSLLTYRRLAEEGRGIAVLPCYVGDTSPSLQRLFPPIEALAGQLWLVSHGEVHRTARVRAFLDYMSQITPEDRRLLAGPAPVSRAPGCVGARGLERQAQAHPLERPIAGRRRHRPTPSERHTSSTVAFCANWTLASRSFPTICSTVRHFFGIWPSSQVAQT